MELRKAHEMENGLARLRHRASGQTIASSVYQSLREDILNGVLLPETKLSVSSVCERYVAGASPVREALSRLSAEGLVVHRDQKGFAVTAASLDHLAELAKTRCWLEARAIAESMAHRSDAWEETILLAYHRMSRRTRFLEDEGGISNPEWELYHREFHRALISECGSSILIQYCDDLRDRFNHFRFVAARQSASTRNAADEHKAIMDAVFAADVTLAVDLLTAHYQRTFTILRDKFRE